MAASTKDQIREAIHTLASGEDPFCTAAEIAEYTGLSKVTVNKHVQDVVAENYEIKTRKVGRTPIYYRHYNRIEDLPWGEGVEARGVLPEIRDTEAAYYVLREPDGKSKFDYVVDWYNHEAKLLEDYQPNPEEMGHAMAGYGAEPVAIKYCDYEDPTA